MVEGHVVFLDKFLWALEAKYASNQTHITAIDSHLSTSEWYCSNQIQGEIDSYQTQINLLNALIAASTVLSSTALNGLQNTRQNLINLCQDREEKLARLGSYVNATRGIYDEPDRLMDEADRLLMRIEHAERSLAATGMLTVSLPSPERLDAILRQDVNIEQEYKEVLNRMRGTIIDSDLQWFEKLFKMGHKELALRELKFYEELHLTLQRESRQNSEYNLLVNIVERVTGYWRSSMY